MNKIASSDRADWPLKLASSAAVPGTTTPAMCGRLIAIGTRLASVTTIWASAASQLALLGEPKILTRHDSRNHQFVPGEVPTGVLVDGQELMRTPIGGFFLQFKQQ